MTMLSEPLSRRDRLRAEIEAMSPEQRERLLRASVPRLVEGYVPHVPHPAQVAFLLHSEKEVFFGGAGGGGKSDSLIMAATQYVDVPGYSALILRRTFQDLAQPGAIMDRADTWFSQTNAKHRDGKKWEFPTNDPSRPATITFGYLQRDADVEQYRGAEYQFCGFDELTQFNERPYRFLFSRLRGPSLKCNWCRYPVTYGFDIDNVTGRLTESKWKHDEGWDPRRNACPGADPDRSELISADDGTTLADVPLRMRSASNPGGVGHQWVRDRLVEPKTAVPGSVFIPASLFDNPSINRAQYREGLALLTSTERARIEQGDWDAADEGTLFKRDRVEMVEDAPPPRMMRLARFWDLAATAPHPGNSDPDWTVGVMVGLEKATGTWWILDAVRMRDSPAAVASLVSNVALGDRYYDPYVSIRMEQEPGSAGVNTIAAFRQLLTGYDFDSVRPTGSKEERARAFGIAWENKLVKMIPGDWNRWLVDELVAFPGGAHDDAVDASAGAFNAIALGTRLRVIV